MIHIQRFVERLQGFEARGAKDYNMPLKDAKDLHADITKLLLALETLRSNKNTSTPTNNDVITVEMTGGSFK
jgi:hypothetical protein